MRHKGIEQHRTHICPRKHSSNQVGDKAQAHCNEDLFDGVKIAINGDIPENAPYRNYEPGPRHTGNQLETTANSNKVGSNQSHVRNEQHQRSRDTYPPAIVFAQDFGKTQLGRLP